MAIILMQTEIFSNSVKYTTLSDGSGCKGYLSYRWYYGGGVKGTMTAFQGAMRTMASWKPYGSR